MSATCGRVAFSRAGSYAQCTSGAASRHTGASRCSKHSSATKAAISAPNPLVRRVLVQHEHAPGAAHRLGDQLAIPRRDRAQVDDLDAGIGAELLRGDHGPVDRSRPTSRL
jgi:hypothetical protein